MLILKRIWIGFVAKTQLAQILPLFTVFGVQKGSHQRLGKPNFAEAPWNLLYCPRGLVA